MKSYSRTFLVGPKSSDKCPCERKVAGGLRLTKEEKPGDQRGEGCGHESSTADSHQKLEGAKNKFSLEPQEAGWPYQPLDFRLLGSTTVSK